MKGKSNRLLVSGVCTSFFCITAFSKGNNDDLALFQNLVSIVAEDPDSIDVDFDEIESDFDFISIVEEQENDPGIPSDLLDIVSAYYAEEVAPKNAPTEVLAYMSRAYSEHGYNESGGWVPEIRPRIVPNAPKAAPSPHYPNYQPSKTSVYNVPTNFNYPSYLSGDFRMPINGSYTSFFGYRPKFGRYHKGVDIALKVGDTVRCALPGVVVKVKCDPKGYGNYVVVRHGNDLETLYAHLTRELVVSGQKLRAGEALGLGGTTGNSTGPHLHFETRVKGEAIDPLFYLPKKASKK